MSQLVLIFFITRPLTTRFTIKKKKKNTNTKRLTQLSTVVHTFPLKTLVFYLRIFGRAECFLSGMFLKKKNALKSNN